MPLVSRAVPNPVRRHFKTLAKSNGLESVENCNAWKFGWAAVPYFSTIKISFNANVAS